MGAIGTAIAAAAQAANTHFLITSQGGGIWKILHPVFSLLCDGHNHIYMPECPHPIIPRSKSYIMNPIRSRVNYNYLRNNN